MSFAIIRSPTTGPGRFGESGQDLTFSRLHHKTGSARSGVSVSMDNLFTQDAIPDWFKGTSSFRRTEELQCVFIPDEKILKQLLASGQSKASRQICECSKGGCHGNVKQTTKGVRRSESFHVSRKVEISAGNVCGPRRPVSGGPNKTMSLVINDSKSDSCTSGPNGVQVKRSASMYARVGATTCCNHGNQSRVRPSPRDNRKQIAYDGTGKAGNTRSDVQMQRCLSLYERAKVQGNQMTHECSSKPTKDEIATKHEMSQAAKTFKTKSPTGKNSQVKSPNTATTRQGHAASSTGSSSRPFSRLSMNSGNSFSDVDLQSTQVSRKSVKRPKTDRPPSSSNNKATPKPSAIPRPSTSTSTSPTTRNRSNSLETQGPMNGHLKNKALTNSFVTRSVPSTPTGYGFRSGVFTNKDNIDLSSTETLNVTKSSLDPMPLVDVEAEETGYPEPRPSTTYKHDLYSTKDFRHVDDRAIKASKSVLGSFDELVYYLCNHLTSEMTTVRALFTWLTSQTLPLSQDSKHGDNTPLGLLYAIRQHRTTYAEMFAVLCRKAGIPCVVIYGIARSVTYEVGERVSHRRGRASWNAVYVKGEWRLIHVYWAAHVAKGYNTGRWALVDSSNNDVTKDVNKNNQPLPKEDSSHNNTMHDYYFFTNPEKFIIKCFPDDPSWQLLDKPLTKHEFESRAFTQPAFHELKLKDLMYNSCIVMARNGRATFEYQINMPLERVRHYQFGYRLLSRRDSEAEGEYDVMTLERYCLSYQHEDRAFLQVRFPAIGVYKLEVHCKDPRHPLPSSWVCDYKVVCREVDAKVQPLPILPDIGWGITESLLATGIECRLTHSHPIINLDKDTNTFIRLALPKDKNLQLDADLLANTMSHDELKSHVTMEQDGDHVVFVIAPPGEGEYALQIYVKEDDGRRNVLNYLLQRTTPVEDPELADIRSELVKATASGDVDSLSHWIDKFTDRGMDDCGDLTKARNKLTLAKLHRDLSEAIARKDLYQLERALHNVNCPTLRSQLGDIVKVAEALRSRLRRFKRLQHEVLDMDQKTISEIRSYPKPPPAVHAVMMAAFMLLGHREKDLQDWSRIQGLISKRGKESLKRRVEEFDVSTMTTEVTSRVLNILSRYDLETVQMASVGAATFYQWAHSMVIDNDDDNRM